MKNGKEKTTITVSTRPGLDSRGWFEEKSNRILEELSFLADILHRPGDAPSGGWPSKREEIDFHFTQAVRNAMKIASLSGETVRRLLANDFLHALGAVQTFLYNRSMEGGLPYDER